MTSTHNTEPRDATLHVKVTESDKQALSDMARAKDISVAQLVRTMIRAMAKSSRK